MLVNGIKFAAEQYEVELEVEECIIKWFIG
jgi:hypothetical protein